MKSRHRTERDASDTERPKPRESVARMKHNLKSFGRSKPRVFTDQVETETVPVVCPHICVCLCVSVWCLCVSARTWRLRESPHVCACVCAQPRVCVYMWIAVSHGRAADVVSDSLVKFQQSMKRDMKVASVRVCARV